MAAAIARLDRTLSKIVAAHGGVRPVGQNEGDGFVVGFARASEAVACALGLQRAELAPIRLQVGVHTGEVQLGDEGNYIGSIINRTARLCDLAHGGQTVLSGTTEALVLDRLPTDAWLTDLGTYPLRGVPRPERVLQLCHPDLRNEFPPLYTPSTVVVQHLPVKLTTFIGRRTQINVLATLFLQAARLGAYTYIGAIFAVRFGMDVSALGLVGLLAGAGSMVGSLTAGTILDRLARRTIPGTWVSVVAALLFILCAVVAATTGHVWVALASLGLWCMCGGAFHSSQQAFLSSADPSQRATVIAWNNSMVNAGIAAGTTALGFVAAGSLAFATITGALGLAALTAAALLLITNSRAGAAALTIRKRLS
jgi:hypothetical protein